MTDAHWLKNGTVAIYSRSHGNHRRGDQDSRGGAPIDAGLFTPVLRVLVSKSNPKLTQGCFAMASRDSRTVGFGESMPLTVNSVVRVSTEE